jgi:ATP-binding cassette, subfamily C (CFTR/MRP), member 1
MVPRSASQLHGRLLSSVRNAPLSFFTSTNIGQVVNRFSQDMNVCDFELPWAFFEFTASTCIAIMQAILICLSAAYFAAIMPAVLGLMYLIQKFYLRTSRQVRLMDLEAKSPLYSNFIESLNGLVTIRAFGWSLDFEESNIALLDKSQRPFYMLLCIQRWLSLVLDLTVAGLAVLLMVLIVVLRRDLDTGLVGVALLNIMNFNLSLTEVIKQWTTLETSLGAISRVKTFVQTTTSEHLPQEIQSTPDNWPSQGLISLSNVSASYTPRGPLVLKDITLSIPAGQKVGLVGRSGSGKSSFVTTLSRMLEIVHGTITIDGVDLTRIPREQVRQCLNVIPQDPLFLSGTIRANLDPFSLARADSVLISTLQTVGLWTIISHAGGLDVPLDPENLFSHGQRQLFCLARAIIGQSQSRILILDETTASVDLQTDNTMQCIIRDKFKECTIIAVAHRLGTIRDFDRVVVLDEGRIVEDGIPDALIQDENSWFRRLWDS